MAREAPAARVLLLNSLVLAITLALAVPAALAAGVTALPVASDAAAPAPCAHALAVDVARAFEGAPGFVDAFVERESPPRVVALFDADALEGARVPAVPADVAGAAFVTVRAERFVPIMDTDPASVWDHVPQPCAGIRPGAAVQTPVGGCSANFAFEDAEGRAYIGTAGHCFSAVGQRLRVAGQEVGTNVWFVNGGIGRDFALVRVDADKAHLVDPAMCHWGGPTAAVEEGEGLMGEIVRHHGNGVGWGATQYTEPRSAVGWFGGAGRSFTVMGLVASGDSGSGARFDDGRALGVLTHVNGGGVLVAHSAPNAYGTTVTHAMALAEAGTGLDLTLLTAPVAR